MREYSECALQTVVPLRGGLGGPLPILGITAVVIKRTTSPGREGGEF